MSVCRLCNSPLRKEIDELVTTKATGTYIRDWLLDRGEKFSLNAIYTHIKHHKESQTTEEDVDNTTVVVDKVDKVIIFSDYLARLKITETELIEIAKDPERSIGALQIALNLVVFKNLCLIDHQMDATLNRESKYPIEKVKGLKLLLDSYFKAMGIDKIIDENAAIETLTKAGYNVKQD